MYYNVKNDHLLQYFRCNEALIELSRNSDISLDIRTQMFFSMFRELSTLADLIRSWDALSLDKAFEFPIAADN